MASTPQREESRGARYESARAAGVVADPGIPTRPSNFQSRSGEPARIGTLQYSRRGGRPARHKRRLVLVTGNYDTVADGVSRTLTRLVEYLERHGYEVLVVGPKRSPDSRQSGGAYLIVPSIPVPGRSEYQFALRLPMKARAAIETFDPHLVHIATPDLLGFRTLAWAGAHDVPVVSSYHTHFPSYLGFYHAGVLKPALERYLTWFYVRCRHVYVPTRLLEDYARGLGLDRNIRRWGRGVDCLEFSPAWRSEVWRRRRGFRADNVVVTFVGRLVREKGLDVFAGVVERLLATGAPIRSMIVGDGPLRSMLQERLPETTFTGHLEGEDLARAYAGSDVFLFPSETEAFGNVIVEAMASALPVVATARSGSSCHVRAERTGLLAPPGDVETFSRQTLRLALDASLRDCMGRQGRGYAKTYDWTRTLDRMLSYYDELLDAPETQP